LIFVTYTGDVHVGGPSDTREIDGLTVTKIAVGPFENNVYLLRDSTGQGLLIDAAAEPRRLLEMIGDTPVQRIVTTHQHADHWQALAEVKAATRAATVAHPADAPGIPVPTDELVGDGGTVGFGDTVLSVIHLVGHTPGSIALCYLPDGAQPHLFTGDCLFPGGVGNTQKDPERFRSLYDGVVSKIFGRLPDATWVYPGHGKDTTLGAERPHLAEWRQRGW
jgi:glyoxylase-like metal-dependent hydrolase (beta-lactamase superfamily II)